jgi:hypothetical protein
MPVWVMLDKLIVPFKTVGAAESAVVSQPANNVWNTPETVCVPKFHLYELPQVGSVYQPFKELSAFVG